MEGKKKENLSRSGAQHSVFSVSSWEIFMSVVFAKKQVCVKGCQGLSRLVRAEKPQNAILTNSNKYEIRENCSVAEHSRTSPSDGYRHLTTATDTIKKISIRSGSSHPAASLMLSLSQARKFGTVGLFYAN